MWLSTYCTQRVALRRTHLYFRHKQLSEHPRRRFADLEPSVGGITITDRCANVINKLTTQDWVKHKEKAKLRVSVDSGGCSGYTYDFALDDKDLEEGDIVFEKDSAKVVVDKESLRHIAGAVIDWKEEMIRTSFVVANNPNAEAGCSCGSSFASRLD